MAQAFLVKRGTVTTVAEENESNSLDYLTSRVINIAGKNGIELLSTEINTNTIDLSLEEFSRGFEGFDITINNLTVDLNYSIVFDFQFTDALWFVSSSYITGVTIKDSRPQVYDSSYYQTNWYTWNSLPEGCTHYISDFNSETEDFKEPILWTSELNPYNSNENSSISHACPGNIARDTVKHRHRITFTATATTMYLSFNLCGCSDNYRSKFDIKNLQLS